MNTLNELLKTSAEKNPKKTVLHFNSKKFSYKSLNTKSDQLALYFDQANIKRNDRVGILMEKNFEALVSIFGILKSGLCYVPIDSTAPSKRICKIVNDSKIQYLIISSKFIEAIETILPNLQSIKNILIFDEDEGKVSTSYCGKAFINLYDKLKTISGPITEFKKKEIRNDDLAYILYTSGSTGTPKGVMITHEASLTFITWARNYFDINCNDKVISLAPLHFDLSIFDIFVSVMANAEIYFPPSGTSFFPKSLINYIFDNKITVMYTVPSILEKIALSKNLQTSYFKMLRQIIFAGESLPIIYYRKLKQVIEHASFYNLYGPTETNVCTYYKLKGNGEDIDSIPIGLSCPFNEVFLLDKNDKRINKVNTLGELCVSGKNIMRGYWSNGELFKNSFSSDVNNSKFYKTGDLASIDNAGQLVFHSRLDSIVKIRGNRVGLKEIENTFLELEKVNEATSIIIGKDLDKKIICFVAFSNKHNQPSQDELYDQCRLNLPQYMVPSEIIVLEILPRLSTGKIDFEKLKNIFKV